MELLSETGYRGGPQLCVLGAADKSAVEKRNWTSLGEVAGGRYLRHLRFKSPPINNWWTLFSNRY